MKIVFTPLFPSIISQLNNHELQKYLINGENITLLNSNISIYNNANIFKSKVELWKVKYCNNNMIFSEFDKDIIHFFDKDV